MSAQKNSMVNQSNTVKSFDIHVCKHQNFKLGSVPILLIQEKLNFKVRNYTTIVKHCELKRHAGSKKHPISCQLTFKAKELFVCSQIQQTQRFQLQIPKT